MNDVFISYAHEDGSSARKLADLIINQGIDVWWDPELRAGQDFAQVIEQILASVKCVVVLWSRHSVSSRWVRAEAAEGLRANKLVPVALDESEPPLIFRGLHTSHLGPGDLSPASPKVEKLLADIKAVLTGRPIMDARGPDQLRPTGEADGSGIQPVRLPSDRRKLFMPAALAAAVLLGLIFLGAPGMLLDYATGVGCRAGFSGNPLVVEGVLLAAFSAIPIVLASRRHPLKTAGWRWLIPIAASCALGTGILFQWSLRLVLPEPDHLYGQVKALDRSGMRVHARGCGGKVISLGDAPVDTLSGDFGLRLKSVFADRPRSIVFGKAGCAEYLQEVPWAEWREKKMLEITFPCRGEP